MSRQFQEKRLFEICERGNLPCSSPDTSTKIANSGAVEVSSPRNWQAFSNPFWFFLHRNAGWSAHPHFWPPNQQILATSRLEQWEQKHGKCGYRSRGDKITTCGKLLEYPGACMVDFRMIAWAKTFIFWKEVLCYYVTGSLFLFTHCDRSCEDVYFSSLRTLKEWRSLYTGTNSNSPAWLCEQQSHYISDDKTLVTCECNVHLMQKIKWHSNVLFT